MFRLSLTILLILTLNLSQVDRCWAASSVSPSLSPSISKDAFLKDGLLLEANDLEKLSHSPDLNLPPEIRQDLEAQAQILRQSVADKTEEELQKEHQENLKKLPKLIPAEIAITTLTGGGALALERYGKPGNHGTWRSSLRLEDSLRDSLKLRSEGARNTADHVSTGLVTVMVAIPFIESGVLAINPERRTEAAHLAMVDAGSFALTALTVSALKVAVGRERPYCRDLPTSTPCTEGGDDYASVPSGHTAFAFTSAGLICSRRGWGAACAAALAVASATGGLRMAADKHWGIDVFAGAAIGYLYGGVVSKYFPSAKEAKRQNDAYQLQHARDASHHIEPLPLEGGMGLAYKLKFF